MKKNQNNELSYYGLSLLSYLKESHPQLVSDTDFVRLRADAAAEAYSNAIKEGETHLVAEELANHVLFKDLLFSKYDTLVNVLWNEFSDIIPQNKAKEFAERILPESDSVFSKYILSDEFESSKEYDKLYTELTGFISLWLEENEL
ncbi:hypothetical protein M2451_002947 [Dysgonomonas sp. PFB1-18]|uniref:DUF1896 domain-containing protein n=1 Tax=unclassified Dysgonomonas TaxID=2630389 RepID=UPI0013D402A5|nr:MULTISPECIES: DUF1896 domain-containing protein [unclassified Dysgonomonas]MDH6310057.1 hypothetical protein [Dysgonomonas sp. PF1-14]MDH6339966.1 hypothetical protein [Dysgonomonas sp. PF1-16]MDH6381614.1 hypothetical protein [Dysgonomonas sp. PFB1-18]MDH6398749.1 hypothetical protein [Dysgonomonas sp. PF1-23]NDV93594.1 DUF1896 domain-containing protein [Dysgonomonas sp. 521]